MVHRQLIFVTDSLTWIDMNHESMNKNIGLHAKHHNNYFSFLYKKNIYGHVVYGQIFKYYGHVVLLGCLGIASK